METLSSLEILSEENLHVQEVLLAASSHDLETLESLITSYSFTDCKAVDVVDSETGFSPLHAAIAACETEGNVAVNDAASESTAVASTGLSSRSEEIEGARETVKYLLENGAIWNQLDKNDETPGCIAHRLRLDDLYGLMVDAGVRAEMLLNRLEGYQMLAEEEDEAVQQNGRETEDRPTQDDGFDNKLDADQDVVKSAQYLSSTLSLSADKLLDDQQNGVMMAWESDIMSGSADALLSTPGMRVLNIGFGMGIIDQYIQNHKNQPARHSIVEAHPDVLKDMKQKGWDKKTGVIIHEGKWQDVLPKLIAEGETFDAIFFDTFAESYADFREFFSEHVIGLLEQGGRWSFFNGLGADRQIVYDVYQKVLEMDLFEAGFEVEWKSVALPQLEKEWETVKRRYWDVDNYRLPMVQYFD